LRRGRKKAEDVRKDESVDLAEGRKYHIDQRNYVVSEKGKLEKSIFKVIISF